MLTIPMFPIGLFVFTNLMARPYGTQMSKAPWKAFGKTGSKQAILSVINLITSDSLSPFWNMLCACVSLSPFWNMLCACVILSPFWNMLCAHAGLSSFWNRPRHFVFSCTLILLSELVAPCCAPRPGARLRLTHVVLRLSYAILCSPPLHSTWPRVRAHFDPDLMLLGSRSHITARILPCATDAWWRLRRCRMWFYALLLCSSSLAWCWCARVNTRVNADTNKKLSKSSSAKMYLKQLSNIYDLRYSMWNV